jgi:hypothetical protein
MAEIMVWLRVTIYKLVETRCFDLILYQWKAALVTDSLVLSLLHYRRVCVDEGSWYNFVLLKDILYSFLEAPDYRPPNLV